ncbi:protein GDAP2 homolog isoform X2 [Amphiura filiformis]|uniref:protein GDAP2 homolog isoform X2 n=1 Tax=Amphiura filiformis TaxID=82378 RepID=UPI003B21CDB1
MDPIGTQTGIVKVDVIPKWNETEIPKYSVTDIKKTSRFPWRPDLNRKIALWEGDITTLDCVGMVHPTNESLNEPSPLTEKIHKLAGPDLRQEVKTKVRGCRTGEAKLTKGYQLPARFVIHTVGPRYNIKYKTAAESALYNCYRNVLMLAKEQQIYSLSMCAINSVKRGYPPEEAAHIAIRTIRRFLEKHGKSFECIVLVNMGINEDIYQDLLPLYFPRNTIEEQWAIDLLPENVGNQDGEPVIAERQIRIMGTIENGEDSDGEEAEEKWEEELSKMHVGQHAFTNMEADPDRIKKQRGNKAATPLESEIDLRRRYERLLRRARTEDLSDIAAHRCIYQTGTDIFGRPIVIFVARNFPASIIDLDKALLYFIHVLDPIVNQDYVAVYFHTLSTGDNQPELSWLKDVYHAVDNRYRKNLKSFYIVHPTVWSRLVTWYFTTFTASPIKDKVHNVTGVHYLYHSIHPDQLDIPPFVLDHDLQVNGPNYYSADGDSETPDGL